MLEKIRELCRGPLSGGPIHACAGDTMNLEYVDRKGNRRTVLSAPVPRAARYTDGVIFEAEEGGRHVLGGYFLEG